MEKIFSYTLPKISDRDQDELLALSEAGLMTSIFASFGFLVLAILFGLLVAFLYGDSRGIETSPSNCFGLSHVNWTTQNCSRISSGSIL